MSSKDLLDEDLPEMPEEGNFDVLVKNRFWLSVFSEKDEMDLTLDLIQGNKAGEVAKIIFCCILSC